MQLTYLGNEGVFVTADDGAVLIDALYREGAEPFGPAPPEVREAVETARPPYDATRVILATHYHHDHFNPLSVARHLENNPAAHFASTVQSVSLLREKTIDYDAIAGRVHEVVATTPGTQSLSVAGIQLEAFALSHGRGNFADVEQLGWIVHLEGRRVLHLGDGIIDERTLDNAGVLGEAIDIAILPFWYVTYPFGKRLLREKFRPGRVFAVHIPTRDRSRLEAEIAAAHGSPEALTRAGSTKTL